MAQPIPITREIFQVGGQGLTAAEDAAIYLIHFNGHAALGDTDQPPDRYKPPAGKNSLPSKMNQFTKADQHL